MCGAYSTLLRHEYCDVHGVAEAEAFVDAALEDEIFDGVGDVYEAASAFDFEPEMFGEGFHFSEGI
jgi:hypothetical protein